MKEAKLIASLGRANKCVYKSKVNQLRVNKETCLKNNIETSEITIRISQHKAPFSLSRFKVPVHPGLMIRDEP